MAGLLLESGSVVDYYERRYTCTGRGPGGGYLLVPHSGRSNQVVKPEAAFSALERGHLIVVQEESEYEGEPLPRAHFDLSALSDHERDQVMMRHFYMRRVRAYRQEGGTLSNSALDDFAWRTHSEYVTKCRKNHREPPKKPMSAAAIRRWFRCWSQSGYALKSLVQDAKGNSHSKLTREQEDLLYAAIHDDYMDKRRISAKHAHMLMRAKINRINRVRRECGSDLIAVPHYNTFCAHLKRIDLYDKLKARYSAAYALKVTRHYGMTPPANRHLERVQVDHTLLDLYVDFGDSMLVRAWLTLILDIYSKAVLGYWLTPSPPSAESVMQALRMASLPKNMRELGGEVDWYWPMHGLPNELTLDNGKEFHGNDLEMVAAELGFTLNFTPPRQPWYKAQVERKFGEINRSLLAQLPGQVYKYEPETHGTNYPHLSLDEFKRIFLRWVTTVLHRTPNRDGYTPEQLWHESVQKHGTPGSGLPSDYIEICLAKTEVGRIVHSDGIRLNSLTFNNEWLSRLRNDLAPKVGDGKPEVKVKWSAADMGLIYVLHPDTHEFFPVRSKEENAHGRSLYNHRVVLREMRARKQAGMHDSSYTDAVLALDQSIKELVDKKAKGKKLGAKVARYEDGKPKAKPRTPQPAPPEPFDADESVDGFDGDIVDTSTGEILNANPDSTRARLPDNDFEDFSDELEI